MMSPELKQAVEERVALGHTKEQIAAELEAAGYDHESIEQIYAAVSTDDSVGQVPVAATEYVSDTPSPGGSLIGYGALVKHGFALAASQWKVFVLTFVYQIGAII
jgi:SOS response regulatory protein OraA/RecX